MTHQQFIEAVRTQALARIEGPGADRLKGAVLTYGIGKPGQRGVTVFDCWQRGQVGEETTKFDVVEIGAIAEENPVQLVGTTLHELAHILAGYEAGHGKDWKAACAALGLFEAEASGQTYAVEHFDAALWAEVEALAPKDGTPLFGTSGPESKGGHFVGMIPAKPRPCPMGIGTRGGKSRGAGSGSRMILYMCACGTKVRASRGAGFDATCNKCGAPFSEATRA